MCFSLREAAEAAATLPLIFLGITRLRKFAGSTQKERTRHVHQVTAEHVKPPNTSVTGGNGGGCAGLSLSISSRVPSPTPSPPAWTPILCPPFWDAGLLFALLIVTKKPRPGRHFYIWDDCFVPRLSHNAVSTMRMGTSLRTVRTSSAAAAVARVYRCCTLRSAVPKSLYSSIVLRSV